MALVTPEEVEALSGTEFSDEDFYLTEALIASVQAEMEAYLGRAIEVREHVRERVTAPRRAERLFLKNYPVQSVSAVWFDGQAFPVGTFAAWSYGVKFTSGIAGFGFTTTQNSFGVYEVTYTGGMTDPIALGACRAVMKRVILAESAKAREGDEGRLGYLSMRVEDFAWTKAEGSVSGLAGRSGEAINAGPFGPGDRLILDRYRRRTVVSG